VNDLDSSVHPIAVPPLDFVAERFRVVPLRYLVLGNVKQTVSASIECSPDEPGRDDHEPLVTKGHRTEKMIVRPTECLSVEGNLVLKHTSGHTTI